MKIWREKVEKNTFAVYFLFCYFLKLFSGIFAQVSRNCSEDVSNTELTVNHGPLGSTQEQRSDQSPFVVSQNVWQHQCWVNLKETTPLQIQETPRNIRVPLEISDENKMCLSPWKSNLIVIHVFININTLLLTYEY